MLKGLCLNVTYYFIVIEILLGVLVVAGALI